MLAIAAARADAPWWFMVLVIVVAVVALSQRQAVFRFADKAAASAPGPKPGRHFITTAWRWGFYLIMGAWLVIGIVGLVLVVLGD